MSWGGVMWATQSLGREAQSREEERGKIQHLGKTSPAQGVAGMRAPSHPGSGPTLGAVPVQGAKKIVPEMCQLILGPLPVQRSSYRLGAAREGWTCLCSVLLGPCLPGTSEAPAVTGHELLPEACSVPLEGGGSWT